MTAFLLEQRNNNVEPAEVYAFVSHLRIGFHHFTAIFSGCQTNVFSTFAAIICVWIFLLDSSSISCMPWLLRRTHWCFYDHDFTR